MIRLVALAVYPLQNLAVRKIIPQKDYADSMYFLQQPLADIHLTS
jgi:hypothetical protein